MHLLALFFEILIGSNEVNCAVLQFIEVFSSNSDAKILFFKCIGFSLQDLNGFFGMTKLAEYIHLW